MNEMPIGKTGNHGYSQTGKKGKEAIRGDKTLSSVSCTAVEWMHTFFFAMTLLAPAAWARIRRYIVFQLRECAATARDRGRC